MAEQGFDVNRSQVSADALAKFLAADLSEDLRTVPGVGPNAIEALGTSSAGDSAVTSTYQLVGKFLSLKGKGMSQTDHLNAFWFWLKLKNVDSHRSGIVHAIAEKVGIMIPGIYSA
jgi:hypothetical protein